MGDIEKVFEGSYLYFMNGQNYSEENFSVEFVEGANNFIYRSEILSRVETGEFFKMKVRYEVNKFHVTQGVVIEKSLGERSSYERFTIDQNDQTLSYTFKGDDGEQTVQRPFGAKHFIMAPSFLTTALFTVAKKIETSSRTPVTFITTPNEWTYQGPPEDKTLYVQLRTHNLEELVVNGSSLSFLKYEIYENDSMVGAGSPTTQLWVSKHLAVPYQLEDKHGAKISVKRLKKLKQDLDKF